MYKMCEGSTVIIINTNKQLILFFFSSLSPVAMAISGFLVCREEERFELLVDTRLYLFQRFVAKNPESSSIWKLATPANTYTQNISAV